MPTIFNHMLRSMREQARPKEPLDAIAKELGTNKAYLSRVETGAISCPKEAVFLKMLDAYACEPWKRRILLEFFRYADAGDLPEDSPEASLGNLSLANSLGGNAFRRKIIVADLNTLRARTKAIEGESCEAVLLPALFGDLLRPVPVDPGMLDWMTSLASAHPGRVFVPDPNPTTMGEGLGLDAIDAAEKAVQGYRYQYSAELVDGMVLVENMNPYRFPFMTGEPGKIERFRERFEAFRRTALPPEVAADVLRVAWESAMAARARIGEVTGHPYDDTPAGSAAP